MTFCARHPQTQTALACVRCNTPICPQCMVSGAVGFLCPDCASSKNNPLYQIRPERLVLAVLAGLAAGTIAGFVLQAISGFFVYLGIFFAAPFIGGILGEVVLRTTGHKRGKIVEILTGVSVIVGAGLSVLIERDWDIVLEPTSAVLFAVMVGVTTWAAVGRIRHL